MIRPTTSSKLALMAAVFVLLTACGGGGGDSGSAAPPAVPDPPNPGTPDPVFGLDTRAANTSCVAPARPIVSSISTPRAFPSISFHLPVLMLQAPQDSTRWYVVQQGGQVKLFTNSSTAATSSTVIDISARVASPDSGANGELGLLGMAFHPNFSTNHFVYLFYSHVGHPVVSYLSRFSSLDNGLTWDPASEQVLLTVTKPYNNHNGGNLAFGADGYLYVGYGDGGSGDDPQNLAQNPQRLLGKMIRIDVDGGSPYGIPAERAISRWLDTGSAGRAGVAMPGAGAALFVGARGKRIDQRAVRELVHRRLREVPGAPDLGPHGLRHTAATQMLRAGASLEEVGQVLRHRQLLTTAIYAKVDRDALRVLARPWPEVRS